MQRRILIVDDNDDLCTALEREFSAVGHQVKCLETRDEAVAYGSLADYDLVITDLDDEDPESEIAPGGDHCLPEMPENNSGEKIVKAFKICASNFRRENFSEDELKTLVETVLNYKARFVDKTRVVRHLHEKIEFEIPSAISLMHSILDYLINRVEKVGVVTSANSNLFIALDEAFVNAVKHGNKFDAAKLVRITAEVSTEEARFTVEDEGEGFDVAAIPDPRDPENLFKTSGRGVLIIHNVMDEVRYNERGNRLEMIKKSDKKEMRTG